MSSLWPCQSPGQPGDGCVQLYSSVVLDYDLFFKIPFILVNFDQFKNYKLSKMAGNLAFDYFFTGGSGK